MKEAKVEKVYGPELADQLAALPGMMVTEGGWRVALFTLTGDGKAGAVRFPDDVDEAAVRQAVDAHQPAPARPPVPSADNIIAAIAAIPASDPDAPVVFSQIMPVIKEAQAVAGARAAEPGEGVGEGAGEFEEG